MVVAENTLFIMIYGVENMKTILFLILLISRGGEGQFHEIFNLWFLVDKLHMVPRYLSGLLKGNQK